MEFLDDNIYIDRVLGGDTAAYAELVDKHKDMVFTMAMRIVRNYHDAEEIAQDVFLKAYQSLETFKRKSKFSTWLYRIVYNMSVSKVRRKKPETGAISEEVVENYTVDDIHENVSRLNTDEQKMLINKALEKLPEEESTIISLYYLNECSIEEIAEITGFTKSNIKVKLHRIRKKLYTHVNELIRIYFKEVYK
jgi:RNA polymerase sigma-70 factor (ECF subfamily)